MKSLTRTVVQESLFARKVKRGLHADALHAIFYCSCVPMSGWPAALSGICDDAVRHKNPWRKTAGALQ